MLRLTRELDYYHSNIAPIIGDTSPFASSNPNRSPNLYQFSQLTITDDEEEDLPGLCTQPRPSCSRPTEDPTNERAYYGSEDMIIMIKSRIQISAHLMSPSISNGDVSPYVAQHLYDSQLNIT
ncbi:hypothetical protein TIFTF001_018661 [Ficus carica]|uniref:Uncharacterized protein n=1 Tax=Ficus carica TaxID=3494 RepID=A0AA88AS60_FICCA|nr:hypothetical protein TIFTF001_018661 [Ficus carica]